MKGLLAEALGRAAASVDRAVLAAASLRARRATEKLGHEGRLAALDAIAVAYDDRETFFASPPAIAPRLDAVRRLPGAEVADASWESGCIPFDEGVRASYHRHVENRTAHARLVLGERPRPAIILIHGYLGGGYRGEERAWPVEWLSRIGLDVALPVLPFHALRGDGRRPRFPGADPRFTNEGFRQAVHDIRGLASWLRERGAPSVGVMGMSLGGYTTSLLATLDKDLAFAVPMIPLASIADFARDQGRLGRDPEERLAQHQALDRANWVTSPLARPSQLAPDRILVIGAEADRITPIAHARRLAAHFDARLLVMPGGHLLQFGRGEAFREVARLLGRLGILPPRKTESP